MSHISLTYHIIWRTHRSERTISEEHENLLREFGLDPEKDLFLKD